MMNPDLARSNGEPIFDRYNFLEGCRIPGSTTRHARLDVGYGTPMAADPLAPDAWGVHRVWLDAADEEQVVSDESVERLRALVTPHEVEATRRRVKRLLRVGSLPEPGQGWRAIPWPPF